VLAEGVEAAGCKIGSLCLKVAPLNEPTLKRKPRRLVKLHDGQLLIDERRAAESNGTQGDMTGRGDRACEVSRWASVRLVYSLAFPAERLPIVYAARYRGVGQAASSSALFENVRVFVECWANARRHPGR
jgi:hypothetical protein